MRPAIFFFFFLILVAPISYAYDCSRFTGVDYDNCVALNSTDENLIANLIYTNTTYPDHDFVSQYNQQIVVSDPPNNTALSNSGVIRNAWVNILTVEPSVVYNGLTYVSQTTNYRAESSHNITLPQNYYNGNQVNRSTCQIIYSVNSDQTSINWFIDGTQSGSGKNIQVISDNYNNVKVQANIETVTRIDYYTWYTYCCRQYHDTCQRVCMGCFLTGTGYTTDRLTTQNNISVENYIHNPTANFTITENYADTFKGVLDKDNLTNVILNFNNSYYKDQEFVYYADFSKQPYDLLYLTAEKRDVVASKNLFITNNNFYVNDASNCIIESSDFFTRETGQCTINISNISQEQIGSSPVNSDLSFLFKLLVFGFIIFIIYKLIKKYWGKTLIPIVCLLLFIPSVSADDCGITNLASCIPQAMYNYAMTLLNAPLEPLLNLIQSLLASSPNISLFQGVWAIIVYCLSLFYGLLFVYSGFLFLFSGHDVMRREMAKEWLKNTVIMIVLVQASFYLYGLFVDLGSIMTASLMSLVDAHFFMITADNLTNIGLEFLLIFVYVLILLVTLLFLTIRYLVVALGVLFVPIGIFCYFIPPLRSYGKLILNLLGMFIFITFIDAIIILACSMLISIPIFQNIKIIVMITCFLIIDILFFILIQHIISKTSLDEVAGKAIQAGKYIAALM